MPFRVQKKIDSLSWYNLFANKTLHERTIYLKINYITYSSFIKDFKSFNLESLYFP